jgi:L-asparaginase II
MTAPPPVVVRVRRGASVESQHRGHAAVVDESGRRVGSCGDPSLPTFLRSAAKPFQALPLLEAGGAEEFRLTPHDVALICASHGGEQRHVRGAARLLARGGFSSRDLVCGPHLPMHEPSARRLLSRGERPTRLHNNCSGKHAGLLLACRLLGVSPKGYWRGDHPLQRAIRGRISELTSFPESDMEEAVDGCGLVVYRVPLHAIALGYARLMSRAVPGESATQARARRRIVAAMWAAPDMVAGTGFFTTELLRAGAGRWIGKEGAEGVYAVGVRGSGADGVARGLALKIEDGSARARPAVTLAILREMGWMSASAGRKLDAFAAPAVTNAAGATVGSIDPEVPIIRRDDSQ